MTTGGGGTNTAATFANQGFKVSYVGKIGDDKRGKIILDELKGFKVNIDLVKKDKKRPTAYSVILSSGDERTNDFLLSNFEIPAGTKKSISKDSVDREFWQRAAGEWPGSPAKL